MRVNSRVKGIVMNTLKRFNIGRPFTAVVANEIIGHGGLFLVGRYAGIGAGIQEGYLVSVPSYVGEGTGRGGKLISWPGGSCRLNLVPGNIYGIAAMRVPVHIFVQLVHIFLVIHQEGKTVFFQEDGSAVERCFIKHFLIPLTFVFNKIQGRKIHWPLLGPGGWPGKQKADHHSNKAGREGKFQRD